MKKFYTILLINICLVFALNPLTIADEMVAVKAGFMTLNPGGNFSVTAAGLGGTSVDLDNDLGLGRSYRGTIEAYFQFADSRITASYLPLKFSGKSTLSTPVGFNGKTFTAGASVESTLKVDIFDIGYTYFLINYDDLPSRLQVGVEAAVKFVMVEAIMKSNSLSLNETFSGTVPVPSIGLRGRIALADFLGLTGRIGGLAYNGHHFLDTDIQVEFSPVPLLGIYAGYRYMKIKVDRSDIFVDTNLDGPVIGVFARF